MYILWAAFCGLCCIKEEETISAAYLFHSTSAIIRSHSPIIYYDNRVCIVCMCVCPPRKKSMKEWIRFSQWSIHSLTIYIHYRRLVRTTQYTSSEAPERVGYDTCVTTTEQSHMCACVCVWDVWIMVDVHSKYIYILHEPNFASLLTHMIHLDYPKTVCAMR